MIVRSRANGTAKAADEAEGATSLQESRTQLNPDEWVWKNVKHDDIKRAGIQRGSELFGIATRALERLQRLPEIIRGFFRDPALAYIGI